MKKAKVYFTDFRTPVGTSWTAKLQRLCIAAGIKDIDFDKKFVAIKMHFGELGNLSFLRPNYAKAIADLVKEQGGLPFLTDWNRSSAGAPTPLPSASAARWSISRTRKKTICSRKSPRTIS